eukprot:2603585-Amphidinium_carterae.1
MMVVPNNSRSLAHRHPRHHKARWQDTTSSNELCGVTGTVSVSNEIRKQGHVVGTNFAVAADQQHNLSPTSGRRLLKRTLLEEQPAVVVASPPCTYLAGFSKPNAKHSPESFAEKRTEAIQIAEIATRIQKEGVQLLALDQCMYGLKTDKGELDKKPTSILTNLPMAEKYLSTRSKFQRSFSYEIGRRRTSAESSNVASKANAGHR